MGPDKLGDPGHAPLKNLKFYSCRDEYSCSLAHKLGTAQLPTRDNHTYLNANSNVITGGLGRNFDRTQVFRVIPSSFVLRSVVLG